jgi:hypothetical protein
MSLESEGGMILTGENRRTRRKTCPSATLPTTNPTWIDQGANPGLRGERPATNDLRLLMSYCEANEPIRAVATCEVWILVAQARESLVRLSLEAWIHKGRGLSQTDTPSRPRLNTKCCSTSWRAPERTRLRLCCVVVPGESSVLCFISSLILPISAWLDFCDPTHVSPLSVPI